MSSGSHPYHRSMGSANVEYGVPRTPAKQPKAKKTRQKMSFKGGRSWMYFILIIALIGGSLYAGLYLSGQTAIRDVVVKGYDLAEPQDILNTAAIPEGILADSLNMIQVIDRIEAMAFIKTANLYVSPTGRLDILVEERIPIGLLIQGDAMALIDKDGHKMPVPAARMPDVPLVYGFSINPIKEPIQTVSFREVSAFLVAMQGDVISDLTISEIGWHKQQGIIALTKEDGVRLIFGTGQYQMKLENWQEFYRTVVPAKGMAAFNSLDFRFKGQIVAMES